MARHISKLLTAAGVAALAQSVAAQDCRLALVLAMDVSSSISQQEDRLQREGLAHALTSPEVVRAFLAGDPVALYAFQWSGAASQVPILPGWVVIDGEDDLAQIADLIAESRRIFAAPNQHSTALGAALVHASDAFAVAPDCRARIVDVSSDGENNEGLEPQAVYEARSFDSVTVNALVINEPSNNNPRAAWINKGARLVDWFQSAVLHGPGAFHVVAEGYEDYERAMTAKLLRELDLPLVSGEVGGADAG